MMFSGQVLSHDDFPLSSSTTTNLIILENVYVGRYDLEEIKFFRYSEFIFRIDQAKASNLMKRDDDAIHEALVIEVWDSSNGAKLYTFEGHNALVYLVCPHSKNNIYFMFSTSCDGQIKAWLRENNDMDDRDVTSRTLSDADRVKVKKALRGVKVEVTHRGSMRRIYRICGLTSHATRELISSVDEQTYGFIVEHARLPCLQVGDIQRANYLPMEVCKIVEGQRYSKRLNERQITMTIISGFWSNCTKIDAHVGNINNRAFSRPGLAC